MCKQIYNYGKYFSNIPDLGYSSCYKGNNLFAKIKLNYTIKQVTLFKEQSLNCYATFSSTVSCIISNISTMYDTMNI